MSSRSDGEGVPELACPGMGVLLHGALPPGRPALAAVESWTRGLLSRRGQEWLGCCCEPAQGRGVVGDRPSLQGLAVPARCARVQGSEACQGSCSDAGSETVKGRCQPVGQFAFSSSENLSEWRRGASSLLCTWDAFQGRALGWHLPHSCLCSPPRLALALEGLGGRAPALELEASLPAPRLCVPAAWL